MHKLIARGRGSSFVIIVLPETRVPPQHHCVMACSKMVTMMHDAGYMNVAIPSEDYVPCPSKDWERELRRQLKRMQAFAWDAMMHDPTWELHKQPRHLVTDGMDRSLCGPGPYQGLHFRHRGHQVREREAGPRWPFSARTSSPRTSRRASHRYWT